MKQRGDMMQQGDIMFLRVDSIPEGATKIEPIGGKYILAEGEATGHAHTIIAEPGMDLYEQDGIMWLVTPAEVDAPVTHEEHGPITITPGIHEIGPVVEIDPFEDEIRRVRD